MMKGRHTARFAVLAFIGSLALGACKDTTDPEPEPDVATMRLVIGTTNPQTITVDNEGNVTGGPISIPVNTATTITATFLREDGTPDPIASTDEFQVEVVDLTPGTITFTRTGDFTGTLTGTVATTSGSGSFGLFHKEEGHFDWGEWTIPISVVP